MKLSEYPMRRCCLVKPYSATYYIAYVDVPVGWLSCEIVYSFVEEINGEKERILVIDK